MAARRRLDAESTGPGVDTHDGTVTDDFVPEQLQIERILANRDPLTGRMLMDINDFPDHLSEEEREHPDAQRDHMFPGRNPMKPWMLTDGTMLI